MVFSALRQKRSSHVGISRGRLVSLARTQTPTTHIALNFYGNSLLYYRQAWHFVLSQQDTTDASQELMDEQKAQDVWEYKSQRLRRTSHCVSAITDAFSPMSWVWPGQEASNDCAEESTYLQGLTSKLRQNGEEKLSRYSQRDLPCLTEFCPAWWVDVDRGDSTEIRVSGRAVRKDRQEQVALMVQHHLLSGRW